MEGRQAHALQEITNVDIAGSNNAQCGKKWQRVEPMPPPSSAPLGILSSLSLTTATLPPPIVAEGRLTEGHVSAALPPPRVQTCQGLAPRLPPPLLPPHPQELVQDEHPVQMMARLQLSQQQQQHQQQPQQQQQQQQQQQWAHAGLSATPEEAVQRVQGTVEYTQEIVNEMFLNEPLFRARVNYMDSQLEINGRMRGILVDWLVEVHMKYRCRPESLYLTINLIDRYLSLVTVARNRLQLVGVAAMLIATKFEEITPPEIGDFVYITDNAYTKEQVLQMECTMLTTLSFQIVVPTAAHFLGWFLQSNRCGNVQRELCRYLVELALLQYEMMPYPSSLLVAAAVLLSNELITRPGHLAPHVAPYDETQLRACANELRALLEGAATSPLQTVRRRYGLHTGDHPHHSVAGMTFPRVI